ncbi:cistern family PEP-CTERM protein [Candidatus Nitrosoglobus terrae]|nr:cistern family PEP-CTERM protein [Candidatus Nitrosoglobus terrae]
MNNKNSFRVVMMAIAASLSVMTAQAATQPSIISNGSEVQISPQNVGGQFNIDWAGETKSSDILSITSNWKVESFSGPSNGEEDLELEGSIDNTTKTTSSLTQAAIMSFGFATDPSVTKESISGGTVFNNVSAGNGPNQTVPGGFKDIDVCIYADGCSGGKIQTGLQAGESDSFTLNLQGDFGDSVTLSTFPVKFQTNEGSFEFGGTPSLPGSSTPPVVPVTPVPEPNMLLLFSTGLLSLGLISYRRRL